MSTTPIKSVSMGRLLTKALVITMTLVVVLVASGFYLFTAAELRKNFDSKVEQTLSYLDGTLAPILWNLDFDTVMQVAQTALQDDIITGVTIWDDLGQKIISINDQIDEANRVKNITISYLDMRVGKLELHFSSAPLADALTNILWISLSVWLLAVISISVLTNFLIRKYFRVPLSSFVDLAKFYHQHPEQPPSSVNPFIEFQPIEEVVKKLAKDVFRQLKELRESEARFRATFEQAAVGIAHVSLEGRFLRVNEKFCEIIGYSEDELRALSFQDITYPDDLDVDLENVKQVLKGARENYSLDKRYFHKDGSVIWINLTVSLVFDSEGNPKYFVSVIKDISERKQAEEKLAQSEAKYRDLVNNAMVGVFTSTIEGQLTFVNDAMVRMFEFDSPEQMIVEGVLARWKNPQERERMLTELEKHGSVANYEATTVTHTGRHINVIFSVKQNDENITGMIMDISERKQAEDALRQSFEFLEHLTSAAPDAIFAVKMPERTIIWVNDSFNILGYENEEYIGRSTSDFYANSEDYEKVGILQQEALRKGKNMIRTEIMVRRKDGGVFPAELVATFYREEGELSQVTAMLRDISERKKAETEIKKSYEEIKKLQKQLQAESAYLQEEIRLEHDFENIIGNSNGIQYALFKVEQVAETDSTVLILGETGTGKELIARAIHHNSQRKDRPLIKINCATLPANLIESELFGHEKGSFTGAVAKHTGRFEVADGSSLFLDEIGELPIELQAKLLRVIEDGEFERLGSTRTIKVDVRIIAATNRDLERDVSEGRFRRDLLYRLNVFPITLPPLRDRVEDIPLIVQYYVDNLNKKLGRKIDSISKKLMKNLQEYTWPGNVRELQNVLERAVIGTSGNKLQLTEELRQSGQEQPEYFKPLLDMERDYIISVLDKTGWKVSGKNSASEILGLDRSTLRARMKKLDIKK